MSETQARAWELVSIGLVSGQGVHGHPVATERQAQGAGLPTAMVQLVLVAGDAAALDGQAQAQAEEEAAVLSALQEAADAYLRDAPEAVAWKKAEAEAAAIRARECWELSRPSEDRVILVNRPAEALRGPAERGLAAAVAARRAELLAAETMRRDARAAALARVIGAHLTGLLASRHAVGLTEAGMPGVAPCAIRDALERVSQLPAIH